MNDSVILTSGRSTPAEAETVQRGEGVALVLRGMALFARRRNEKTVEGLELKMCVSMLASDWERWHACTLARTHTHIHTYTHA